MAFTFPLGFEGLYFCVCAEGGVPLCVHLFMLLPLPMHIHEGQRDVWDSPQLSLPYAPETGSPTVQGLTVHCLHSVVGSPRDLPSPSAPNNGVTGVRSHTQLFIWDLDPELHA